MIRIAFLVALAVASPVLAEKLTPERVYADPDLSGPRIKGLKLSPDGSLVARLFRPQVDAGAGAMMPSVATGLANGIGC